VLTAVPHICISAAEFVKYSEIMADKAVRQWVNKQKNETETEANININWGGYYRNSMAGQA